MSIDPCLWIDKLTFSDETTIQLARGDVVVLVGPNNSGKSATLRAVRDKVSNPATPSKVVKKLTLGKSGTAEDVVHWLGRIARSDLQSNPGDPHYQAFNLTVTESQARSCWSDENYRFQQLRRFFCHLLSADERLTAADPAPAVHLTRQPLTHPIHSLQRNDNLEAKLSDQFRKAFKLDIVVHRNAGSHVPLLVGKPPAREPGEDRVSYNYLVRLEQLPSLETQGDGMRSFAGVLLHTSVGQESILLIDEPEAFLHPPQAKLLGRMLVESKPDHRQVLVATHSGDVLRGVLDGNSGNVRVVRIRRQNDGGENDVNFVKELDKEQVRRLWIDPLLRSSNILDGVFHERVVVCESDGDARFYAAVADALYEGPQKDRDKPDVMFTHCGGKARLPMVLRSLKALDVPVAAVADFDILNAENPLDELVKAAGGDWETLKPMWNSVKTAIDAIKPQLNTSDVKKDVQAVLESVKTAVFPKDSMQKIKDILKQTSPWALAKKSGKAFVPHGTATQQYDKLAAELRSLGIFIVEVGELECFCPAIGGHGPDWVNEVLTKDLKSDAGLEEARKFVTSLLS